MIEGSTELAKAEKAWRSRNSDGRFCLDESGELVECQSPPAFDLVDTQMPFGVASESRYVEDSGYVRRAVLHQHVWDSGVSDPDEE